MVEIAYSHDNHWGEAKRTGAAAESGGLVGRPLGAGLSGEEGGGGGDGGGEEDAVGVEGRRENRRVAAEGQNQGGGLGRGPVTPSVRVWVCGCVRTSVGESVCARVHKCMHAYAHAHAQTHARTRKCRRLRRSHRRRLTAARHAPFYRRRKRPRSRRGVVSTAAAALGQRECVLRSNRRGLGPRPLPPVGECWGVSRKVRRRRGEHRQRKEHYLRAG